MASSYERYLGTSGTFHATLAEHHWLICSVALGVVGEADPFVLFTASASRTNIAYIHYAVGRTY